MELTLWTYEGPPHVGAMRIATSMNGLHYVLHAPQGDTYADLLFTMIERRSARPPVTYTTFEARDLGGDTAELFKTAVRDAYERWAPQAMLVGASCTAELLQDDPGGLARALRLPIPVIPLELPAYQKKENWGASETFYRLVRSLVARSSARVSRTRGPAATFWGRPRSAFAIATMCARFPASLSGSAWTSASQRLSAPRREDIARLGEADFNVVLYPEIALPAAKWLEKNHKQPFTQTIPIGVGATRAFIEEVAALAGVDPAAALDDELVTLALVFALGRLDLSDRQAGLHLRRRHPRNRSGARRADRARLQGRGSGNLFEGVRTRGAERGRGLRSRSAYRRRLSRSRGEGHRTAAGTHSRHPDGAPHRQAARNSLRRHLRADSRSGFPGPIFSADGFRRGECAVRLLGSSPDDGS